MLSMTTRTKDHRYWFEEVCFGSETKDFCSNHFLVVKRLNVVHDTSNLKSSVLIWTNLLLIWNQRFLQQPFSYGEARQCCPWQLKARIIGTDLKRSASNLKPTVSATTLFLLWHMPMLSMTTKTKTHRYWFEEVCFESETNGSYNNHDMIVKRLNVVHDS